MGTKVYVDGQAGTTGLQIHERLAKRSDLELLKIDYEERHNTAIRKELLNKADIVFLCLPEDAAIEAVSFVTNPNTKIIDASTAHRVHPEWTYGMPEIPGFREKIKTSRRVANPGCHATPFVLTMTPLVKSGTIPNDYPVSLTSISGYSGAGKKAIARYEESDREKIKTGKDDNLTYPLPYALGLSHKHIPEMTHYTGLASSPIFTPLICDYYKGIGMTIPLFPHLLKDKINAEGIHSLLTQAYKDEPFVKVLPFEPRKDFHINQCNDTNMVEIAVIGDNEKIILLARIDNLGKGASGAAVQNMNIMMGTEENRGL